MTLEEILDASILIGYHLLCNGADISRVEQSINYICSAYHIQEIHAFAIPSSIVVTISDGQTSLTKTRRITSQQINLERVEKLSGLSRYICENLPDYPEIQNRMDAILELPPWDTKWLYAAYCLSGFAFSTFFGGAPADALVSGALGALIFFLIRFFNGLRANSFFINIICSFTAAFIGAKSAQLVPALHGDKIIIGSIMLLVPGLVMANAMRDFITSDTMTGISRMTEALLSATGTALGAACGMLLS